MTTSPQAPGTKPRIVLSGVNLVEGGTLAIFQDALRELSQHYGHQYEIFALVHRQDLFDATNVHYIELPAIKSSWLRRIKFEYRDCFAISRDLQPHLWLALHDMTPRVTAPIRVVYCHNPAPFYQVNFRESLISWKFTLFTFLYKHLYAINLRDNSFTIVQQQWLREEFHTRYGVRNIIVAHPSVPTLPPHHSARSTTSKIFFYPAIPRPFKNLEVILQAADRLEQRGHGGFEIWLTVDGTENAYARGLREQYAHLGTIRWLGYLSRQQVYQHYNDASCLLFPSKLETWGMPLSEFKQTGKPIFAADLPYAHETIGSYDAASFFPPQDAPSLAAIMERFLAGALSFTPTVATPIPAPYAPNWSELFRLLLS